MWEEDGLFFSILKFVRYMRVLMELGKIFIGFFFLFKF